MRISAFDYDFWLYIFDSLIDWLIGQLIGGNLILINHLSFMINGKRPWSYQRGYSTSNWVSTEVDWLTTHGKIGQSCWYLSSHGYSHNEHWPQIRPMLVCRKKQRDIPRRGSWAYHYRCADRLSLQSEVRNRINWKLSSHQSRPSRRSTPPAHTTLPAHYMLTLSKCYLTRLDLTFMYTGWCGE